MQVLKRFWRQILISLVFIGLVAGFVFILVTHNTATVNIANVNIRKGPGISYAITDSTSKGTKVHIMKRKNNWLYVRYADHKFGWIASWLVNEHNSQLNKTTNISEATIVLDPGHGGSDSGALSAKGKMEKTYTLRVAKAVAKKLRAAGAHVILTRDSDTYVGLSARPAIANKVHADAFISFHFDSSPEKNQASGITTYYYHKSTSMGLAKALSSNVSTLPIQSKGIEFGDFLVIRDNSVPAVLMELGYINDKSDFKTISSQKYPNEVAHAVYAGLTTYFANQ
ncbi:N-acetylmuramoyl-L-alanine amidase [Lactiplantibacillus fabifermentans]|uniref:N-acetylmuramoyl-L-alanine amidase n=2 Tax=Lactiplantibacillus fabifermentans TaxID=483011 RepID=A0A0R2NTV4_9LACO|nr:N-acetylmuramoyl-L-alanine amidase [Lactiplantibacillus fabifermentans]ETY74157.1 cell wall hydrolase [Lactiplantibacillus fabifermentans T30PCM01]KRO28139.1 N-acetylmuramoyl-L-alanine amidase [Lactiplantibacillus fabifermentans DSM 21115]